MLSQGLRATGRLCALPSYPHFSGIKDIMQFWNELEGQTIDGLYPLRRLVRSEGRSAWFETESGEAQNTPATISLTEALTDADEVMERLHAAQSLKHPNLVSIVKVGQVQVDNTLLVYAVMEHIEQSLSDVLQTQALSPEEGREVAEALVGALTAIHQKGMSHGHVEAASVLATEETVKLRSDCLHTTAAGQADDVAGIGATLFHAFTQRKGLTATDVQINRVPAPFAEIIRNSFARRWNLAQISNALKPVLPVATVIPPPPAPAPTAAPAPTPAPAPIPPRPPAPAPARPQPEPVAVKAPAHRPPIAERLVTPPIPVLKTLRTEEEEEPAVSKRKPLALYGALGVVVLAILGWLLLRPHSAPAPANTETAQTVTQPAAPVAPPAEPPPAVKPAPSSPAPRTRPTASAVPADGRSIWRVVAYTYRGQTKAEAMVAEISGKHPDLGAEVFNPAQSGVYLVTVGGAMDHDQAVKMRDKAQRLGLPADSYIENFSK
jgi:eukaryotic-like serine/threonine-protein kinase